MKSPAREGRGRVASMPRCVVFGPPEAGVLIHEDKAKGWLVNR
jgi:hypothetical protein